MIALRDKWTPTSRLFSRVDEGQPRKFVLDCGIAWQNYLDGNGVFREINLTPQPSDIVGYNWMVPGLPFKPYLAMNGARRIFIDRNSQAKRIDFPASKFLANKTFTRVGNSLVWSSNAYDIVMRWENSRVKFDAVVKRNIPFDQVQFDVDKTGLTDDELKAFMSNLTATDSSPEPIVRKLDVSLAGGVLTIGFDLTGMTFPVTIDPTLDLQVGASADDCLRRLEGNSWGLANVYQAAGAEGTTAEQLGGGMRFLNITIAQAATIDLAYLTITSRLTFGATTVNSRISAEDVDDAITFADDAAAFDTRWAARTTARVDWDNIAAWTLDVAYNSPEIKTVIQEIVDRAGWASGNDMVIFWDDFDTRSTTPSGGPARYGHSYNGSTTKAPKLHIEYTAGGVTFVPRLMVV